jgi:hypothetical protein
MIFGRICNNKSKIFIALLVYTKKKAHKLFHVHSFLYALFNGLMVDFFFFNNLIIYRINLLLQIVFCLIFVNVDKLPRNYLI